MGQKNSQNGIKNSRTLNQEQNLVYPKVLVCAPTSDKKSYCDQDYFSMIKNLSYPNYEILICDNSATTDYFNKIKNKFKVPVVRVNPAGKTSAQFITESYQRLMVEACRKECHFVMIIESDVFVPSPDIIERLLKCDLPIVSAIYPIGHGKDCHFLLQKLETEIITNDFVHIEHLKDGLDLVFIDGTIKEIFASGLGCVLIRADIFTQIPFRWIPGVNHWNDTIFYTDLFSKGVKHHVHTGIMCKHRNMEWDQQQALSTR